MSLFQNVFVLKWHSTKTIVRILVQDLICHYDGKFSILRSRSENKNTVLVLRYHHQQYPCSVQCRSKHWFSLWFCLLSPLPGMNVHNSPLINLFLAEKHVYHNAEWSISGSMTSFWNCERKDYISLSNHNSSSSGDWPQQTGLQLLCVVIRWLWEKTYFLITISPPI